MACRKRRFRDRVAAELALAKLRRRDDASRPKTERRTYWCSECRAYHLTSKA